MCTELSMYPSQRKPFCDLYGKERWQERIKVFLLLDFYDSATREAEQRHDIIYDPDDKVIGNNHYKAEQFVKEDIAYCLDRYITENPEIPVKEFRENHDCYEFADYQGVCHICGKRINTKENVNTVDENAYYNALNYCNGCDIDTLW